MTPPDLRIMTQDQVIAYMDWTYRDAQIAPESDPTVGLLRESLRTEDQRQEVLARLGITPDTEESYRMVVYNDGIRCVALIGNINEDGDLTVTHRLRLPAADQLFAPTRECEALRDGRTFVIPAQDLRSLGRIEGDNQDRGNRLELTPDQQRQLIRNVSLLAAADQGARDVAALATQGLTTATADATNTKLPGVRSDPAQHTV